MSSPAGRIAVFLTESNSFKITASPEKDFIFQRDVKWMSAEMNSGRALPGMSEAGVKVRLCFSKFRHKTIENLFKGFNF